jgi:hypothetical protein
MYVCGITQQQQQLLLLEGHEIHSKVGSIGSSISIAVGQGRHAEEEKNQRWLTLFLSYLSRCHKDIPLLVQLSRNKHARLGQKHDHIDEQLFEPLLHFEEVRHASSSC